MATRTFELTVIVPVSPESAIDFLMDLPRHFGLHPFVVSAEVTAQGSGTEGAWTEWRVTERPRLGPVRYTIRFPARMLRTSDSSMRADVRAAPGCFLKSNTNACQVDGGTQVTEVTTVIAPRIVLGYMASQAQVAHARTFANMPEALGA